MQKYNEFYPMLTKRLRLVMVVLTSVDTSPLFRFSIFPPSLRILARVS